MDLGVKEACSLQGLLSPPLRPSLALMTPFFPRSSVPDSGDSASGSLPSPFPSNGSSSARKWVEDCLSWGAVEEDCPSRGPGERDRLPRDPEEEDFFDPKRTGFLRFRSSRELLVDLAPAVLKNLGRVNPMTLNRAREKTWSTLGSRLFRNI